ncbi:MAG: hypothetical protein Q9188_001993 [Gyalolechia gomerana]
MTWLDRYKSVGDIKLEDGSPHRIAFYSLSQDDIFSNTAPRLNPQFVESRRQTFKSFFTHAHLIISNLLSHLDTHLDLPSVAYLVRLVAFRSKEDDAEEPEDFLRTDDPDSQVFADMVERRAKDPRGGQRFARIWYGIVLQLFWIAVVMTACWFAGSGSIFVWWCKGWGWMWLWQIQGYHHGRSTEILDALEAGYNCKGQVIRDGNEPWSSSRVPFYVIISLEGISGSHAALRVFSKAFAVGVFVTGTAIFASTQLVEMSVAVAVLCLVLGAGVFGRVIAMWMASEMMKTKPVLHRVVKSRGLAAEYLDRILSIDGLVVEVMGHVIVNGMCIHRYNPWFRWSNWLGLLAGPYNIGKLTMVN